MEITELLKNLNIPTKQRYISIHPVEGEFMHHWVKDNALTRTLEIGLAFGVSACCIMSAHENRHTCIDPFQKELFDNIGLTNIESLGFYNRADFHAEFSHVVLPGLLAEKRVYDFAFIDGDHRCDGIFLDFYYIDKLLCDRGYVLFHDAWMRGTQLVVSFIKKNRKDYKILRCPIRNMLLIQKIGIDNRQWDHFHEFYTWKGCFSHKFFAWMLHFHKFTKNGI